MPGTVDTFRTGCYNLLEMPLSCNTTASTFQSFLFCVCVCMCDALSVFPCVLSSSNEHKKTKTLSVISATQCENKNETLSVNSVTQCENKDKILSVKSAS